MARGELGHRELGRYLLDGERLVAAVHQHWGKVAEPVATALVGGFLALWVDENIPASARVVATAVWWAWLVLVGRAAYRVAEWRHDWFVATDKRLLLFHGFITRRVSMMPLSKVTDMSYSRSVPGRLLGYGTFTMESAGQDQALRVVDWVPQPDAYYRAICAEIFGVPETVVVGEEVFDDPYAALPDDAWPADQSRPIPVRRRDEGESLYRSPDPGRPSPEADTGPITYRPRRRGHPH